MRNVRSQWIGVAILFLLMAAAAVAGEKDEAEVATVTNSSPDQVYWTPEKLANAQPAPMPEAAGAPFTPNYWEPPGPPETQAGKLPDGVRAAPADMKLPDAPLAADKIFGGTKWYQYPPPYSRFNLKDDYSGYPNSTLGKLFFSDNFGNNFVCSGAAVVCTGDQDLVMTAGHCCSDGAGSFHNSFLFVPSCKGVGCASQPYGSWNWQQVTVLTAWHTGGDLARDVCWMKVAPNGAGQELHQVTGALGFAWNQIQPIHYVATGWPAAPPFSGWRAVLALASTADLDGSMTPNTVGIGNDMTGGSSGGAWVRRYRQSANPNQFWNGLNSYHYTVPSRLLEMYGPYIDTLIQTVKATSINCP